MLLALSLLGSCRYVDLASEFNMDQQLQARIIDQTEDRFSHIAPLELSDEIRNYIDTYISPRDQDQLRVDKLQTLLFDEDYLHIQYDADHTQTAVEVFESRAGNCLSVMNLYIAMARYAGVNANFQTVRVQPTWDRRGGMLVLNQHINATGKFDVRRHYVVDFTPEIALQQMTADVVTDTGARALYFNNLGVEELVAGNYEQSLIYFKNALWLDSQLSIAWNNIGTSFNRLGILDLAEYSYQQAFSLDAFNATAVNNLAKYYADNGNLEKAEEYRRAIIRFSEKNPYYHFARGNLAFANDDFNNARIYFQRAVRLKKEEPDFYIALARTFLALGDTRQAERHARSAQEILAMTGVYQPSNNKVRIFDNATILRDSSPGISVLAPTVRRNQL